MGTALPPEILMLIVQYTSKETLASLSAVARKIHIVSTHKLYASIRLTKLSHAVKCLLTLSANPSLARLVQSFHFHPPFSSPILGALCTLLERALWNMSALHELSLNSSSSTGRPRISTQASCRLTKLEITLGHEEPYPISDFLSAQPYIEELSILCLPGSISTLRPEALPALRFLSATLWLLPILLPGRVKHLDQLTVLRDIQDPEEFILLGEFLKQAEPPKSIAVLLQVDLTTPLGAFIIPIGLTHLGETAPFISLLGIRIYKGQIKRDELKDIFPYTLPKFPNLRSLLVMFRSSAPNAWPPQVQLIEPFSDTHSSRSDSPTSIVSLINSIADGWPPFKRLYTSTA